jgi:hypothetical protein
VQWESSGEEPFAEARIVVVFPRPHGPSTLTNTPGALHGVPQGSRVLRTGRACSPLLRDRWLLYRCRAVVAFSERGAPCSYGRPVSL